MKKLFLAIFSLTLLSITTFAQKNNTYPVVVSFYSKCCGVPDNAPLMKLISSFKKQNRIKYIAADNIGPMGKEGEYNLAFRLKELNKIQKAKFIQQLKKVVPTMHERGSAEVQENMVINKEDLSSRATITTKKL